MYYVCGMFGSGTSLVSLYLQHLGVNMMGNDLPTKFGEDLDFQKLARQVIAETGVDRLAPVLVKPDTYRLSDDSLLLLQTILAGRQEPWGVKMPTLSILSWLFIPEIGKKFEPTIVIVFREPSENLRSFKERRWLGEIPEDKTLFYDHMEKIWLKYNLTVLDFYKTNKRRYNYRFVQSSLVRDDPKLFAKKFGLAYKEPDSVLDRTLLLPDKHEGKLHSESVRIYRELLALELEQSNE